ncbi:MAG TPA: radical SAM protein [Euryarchaeota archaeon]|nr:radical SAM protein [Euryarchaeota archaeon]
MKVVLSTPPGKTTELWPPLGLLYIASSMRQRRGDDVQVIDAFCENLTGQELIERVVEADPNVFGMNCSTHTFLSTIETMKGLKERMPDAKLVLGGYHATFAYEKILREYPFIDFILCGEGEHSFPQLLERIEDDTRPSDVDGIAFEEDGEIISRPFKLIEDLDSLPFPARELTDRVEYGYSHQNIKLTFGKFTTICTSRGCPYRCTYCSCAELSLRRWRARSAENIVEEMESLYNQGYECCVVVDDNFTQNRRRVEEICGQIRKRKIDMQFYCEGRVDVSSYEMLRQMKDAGFNVIYYGVESASQNVLDYYKKNITPEKSRTAIDNARKAGMLVVTSYIVGAPIESREDIKRTIDFIRDSRPHAIQVNILDCLIGTPIWDQLEHDGLVGPEDWKINHRIFEYMGKHFSEDELTKFKKLAYGAHIDGWKNINLLTELLRLFMSNESARKIIFGNILNPNIRSKISEEQPVPDGREFLRDAGVGQKEYE